SCPTSCPQRGCERYTLQGSAATCTALCVQTGAETQCKAGDQCCPPGCNLGNDSDCACTCGNGMVEGACGETCDPLSSCPQSCPRMGCPLRRLANPGTCHDECVDDRPQTTCLSGDGCCPSGCNAGNDSDCQPACGNGVVEVGETCDPPGSCPTRCPPLRGPRQKLQATAAAATPEALDPTPR